MRKKGYTDSEIELLNQSPYVKNARSNRLTLTYEFRLLLYNEWVKSPHVFTIKNLLKSYGLSPAAVEDRFAGNLHRNFKRDGRPSTAKNRTFHKNALTFRSTSDDNHKLISTGKFIASKRGHGISFHPDFVNELFNAYPGQYIEDGLRNNGIDPELVGYQRIYHLKQIFDGVESHSSVKESYIFSDSDIEKYSSNPYISKITHKQIRLNPAFFNAAMPFQDLHINDVLAIFEIDPAKLSIATRNRIKYKLNTWEITADTVICSPQTIRIEVNRMNALKSLLEKGFADIKATLPDISQAGRKYICEQLHTLPSDPAGKYSTRRILSMVGISKTSYYSILKNDSYGSYEALKQEKDEKDIRIICDVIDYKGFDKGARQIYMMMPQITGFCMSLNKIKRLMGKYGIKTDIRVKKQSRIDNRKKLEENTKTNLLKRRFKLHRPEEVCLTDVTYMDYGLGLRAYGSACIDPVTGKLLSFDVSSNNDLELVSTTLENAATVLPKDTEIIFHSDQGALYLTDTFQDKVKKLGFTQSMSRRGNCWDNAPQESFWGHFKDECHYEKCNTVEEVKELVAKYADYYNNERCQWSRKRMTPMQYDLYMKSLDFMDFNEYLDIEEEKYRIKRENAARLAIKRAKDIGAA